MATRRLQSSLVRIADPRTILFALIVCAAAVGVPLLMAAFMSFAPASYGENGFSLDGYRDLIAGGRLAEFRSVLLRAVATTVVTMTLAIPSAYWLARIQNTYLRATIFALLVAPWFVSDMLRAFGWQILLSPEGPISVSWSKLIGHGQLEGLRYNWVATVVGIVSSVLPVGILSVFAALPSRSRMEWLAAKEIGAPRHTFCLIAIRWANPGIVIGFGTVFMLSCYASAEPRFLDGPT